MNQNRWSLCDTTVKVFKTNNFKWSIFLDCKCNIVIPSPLLCKSSPVLPSCTQFQPWYCSSPQSVTEHEPDLCWHPRCAQTILDFHQSCWGRWRWRVGRSRTRFSCTAHCALSKGQGLACCPTAPRSSEPQFEAVANSQPREQILNKNILNSVIKN